jgi:ComF family protein
MSISILIDRMKPGQRHLTLACIDKLGKIKTSPQLFSVYSQGGIMQTARQSTLTSLRTLGEGLVQIVYPAACQICLEPLSPSPLQFCPRCLSFLDQKNSLYCWRCGSTIGPYESVTQGCARCRSESFAFSRVYRFGSYEGLLREVVLRMKSNAGENLAEAIGRIWGERLCLDLSSGAPVDLVIPVPLHWWRRIRRGYNQAEALGHSVARRLHADHCTGCLVRSRRTPLQTALSATARRSNVKGAFRARRPERLRGKRVLLVDDVMTTSSTVNEAAKALRDAGAAEVIAAVLAHSAGP